MPFAFRLERVLSVRRIQEEAARARHVQALEELRRAQAALAELYRCLEEGQEELDGLKRRDELTIDALHLYSLHVAGLRREIYRTSAEGAEAAARADQAATELREAHRAREALEKLRERDQDAWRKSEARREAKDMDETAVTRHRAREEENHGP